MFRCQIEIAENYRSAAEARSDVPLAEEREALAAWFFAVAVFPEPDLEAVCTLDLWVEVWAVSVEECLLLVGPDEEWRDLACRDGVLITASCLGETGR